MKTKLVYIIGAIVIGLATTLAIIFGLVGGDVIEVEKTAIVFESSSSSAIYDGTEHTCNEYKIIDGALKEGHTANVVVFGAQTVVGSSPNYMSVTITDNNGTDVSDYYTIDTKFGTLTVDKAPLTITSKSDVKQFDGQPLTKKEYTLGAQSKLASGHNINIEYTQSIATAGTILNAFSATIIDENGNDVTSNYNITKEYGALTVLKKNITISSATNNKIYDGTPLSDDAFSYDDNAIIAGHYLTINNNTSITDIGIIDNKFTYTILDENNVDVSSNYEVTCEYGKLQVGERKISIKTDDITDIYSGQPLKYVFDETKPDNIGYELLEGEIVDGDSFNIKFVNSQTDVGTNSNVAIWTITNKNGQDVTANYIVGTTFGTITVTKRPITLESATKSKVYDGTPLTNIEGDLSIKSGTIIDGDNINYRATTSITDVTSQPITNAMNPVITDKNGKIVTSNYEITTKEGTFTITKLNIVLSSPTVPHVYDGQAVDRGTISIKDSDGNDLVLVDNKITSLHKLKVNFAQLTLNNNPIDELVNVNEVDVINKINFTFTDLEDNSISDWAKNYNVTVEEGKLNVTPKPISITSKGFSITYDGTQHELKETKETISDLLVPGDNAIINYSKSIINATDENGIDNEFTINIYNGADDITSNYSIARTFGKLIIKKRQLTISTTGGKRYYNGEPLFNKAMNLTSTDTSVDGLNAIVDADEFIMTSEYKEITLVGKVINSFTYKIVDKDDPYVEVTDNYNITESFGELEIEKAPLKISLKDKSQTYDGTTLMPYDPSKGPVVGTDYVIDNGQIFTGHTFTYQASDISYITEAGTVPNRINENTVSIMANGENVTSCFDFSYIEATLTVTQRSIIIQSSDYEAEYTGNPITYHNYSISGSVAETDYIVVPIIGTITSIGTKDNDIGIVEVYRRDSSISNELTIPFGSSFYIDSNLIESDYTVKLIGFTQDVDSSGKYTKYYVSATKNSSTYYGVVDSSCFNPISGYSTSDQIVTSSYSIATSLGELTVLYSKETTGLSKSEEYNTEYNVLQIKTGVSGPVYLRSNSYGTYNGNSWSKVNEYNNLLKNDLNVATYSYNYLTSSYLADLGLTATSASIKLFEEAKTPYVVPYYQIMSASEDKIQTSDTLYSGTSKEYTVNYFNTSYSAISGLTDARTSYVSDENDYYNYVNNSNTYLQIDDTTRSELESIMSVNSIDDISDVINFASKLGCSYNMSYDRNLDLETNKVISFLTEYKQGVCSHFAEAAVLMLRVLGYPARYTTGYYAYGQAGEWITITNMKRHAWTEVYLQGKGWVQIDATAGGVVSNTSSVDYSKRYTVKPIDVEYQLTDVSKGPETTITTSNLLTGLSELEAKGYTYKKVEYRNNSNSRTNFGKSYSTIESFSLVDPNGRPLALDSTASTSYRKVFIDNDDSTKRIIINLSSGILQIYLQEFEIITESVLDTYDGTAKSNSTIKIKIDDVEYDVTAMNLDDKSSTAKLAAGHKFTVLETTSSQTIVGISSNAATYKIYDNNGTGTDVTNYYKVTESFGKITINAREIEITAVDASKEYDGTPLVCTNSNITTGSLAATDHIESITYTGSITNVGTAKCSISSVIIWNSSNQNVTSCYKIVTKDGTLTVTIPTP